MDTETEHTRAAPGLDLAAPPPGSDRRFVQIPCIERCAFGAVKSWTGYLIAKNEISVNRKVDLDSTVDAMALTAKEMNSKYKGTSEGGLAVSVVLC